jgi:hypothetical protein
VKFASPGPAEHRIPDELRSIFTLLESKYPHDFSSCGCHAAVGDISDMGDLDEVTVGAMHMMKNELKCADDHPIMRLALETNNAQFSIVQVAWAYKKD